MPIIYIRELWIYPVKSLGGVRRDETPITASGSLAFDREWIVVDAHNRMVWQGDIPRMTLVQVSLDPPTLSLQLAGYPALVVPIDHSGAPADVTMYKQTFSGIDAGDAAAAWLSGALGLQLRLVRIGAAAHLWSGLNPVHVVSEASIGALNEALLEQGDDTVTTRRFRPNVVLGSEEISVPYAEESNLVLNFGEARLSLREPCVRCELPNISLVDASRGTQPLKLIGRLSRERPAARPASFGTYCRAEGQVLRTGMRATIQ